MHHLHSVKFQNTSCVDEQGQNLPHDTKFLITVGTENSLNAMYCQPNLQTIVSSVKLMF
jgi:hypothetical protein